VNQKHDAISGNTAGTNLLKYFMDLSAVRKIFAEQSIHQQRPNSIINSRLSKNRKFNQKIYII